ncbi:MAG TPA: M55 family metallopeptidase [Candidatus Limnocylindria bacterium]|nr:M55 family metallopeptidase [Candidatus Limnocylindria bacterium]
MKAYLSVDMEGIGGISHSDPTDLADRGYPAAVALMVGETNAAIEGAFAGGATEVLVNDSHGQMYNLTPEALDARATLLQGQKPWSMVAGAGPDEGFDVALFVGYHTRAGHPTGTIAHTYTSELTLTTLQGKPANEAAINALALGAWGVPVGLISGDDQVALETEGWFPWAERVVVKTAVSRRAATSVHPSVARERVREGAERAVRRAAQGELQLFDVGRPIVLEAEYRYPAQADYAALVPGSERYGDRGVRVTTDDPVIAFRTFLAGVRIAGVAS